MERGRAREEERLRKYGKIFYCFEPWHTACKEYFSKTVENLMNFFLRFLPSHLEKYGNNLINVYYKYQTFYFSWLQFAVLCLCVCGTIKIHFTFREIYIFNFLVRQRQEVSMAKQIVSFIHVPFSFNGWNTSWHLMHSGIYCVCVYVFVLWFGM